MERPCTSGIFVLEKISGPLFSLFRRRSQGQVRAALRAFLSVPLSLTLPSLPRRHCLEPLVSGGERALFKCRATHSSDGGATIRALVHNPVLASKQRALLAAWDSSTGDYLAERSCEFAWAAPIFELEGGENAPPGRSFPALKPGRYGGIDCASVCGAILATGHGRDADGVCRVRLWTPVSGGTAEPACVLEGPMLPTKAFSTAGVLQGEHQHLLRMPSS